MTPLISTAWLADHLGARNLRILDCTYLDPALGRDARAEYEAAHIPGGRFLDLKTISNPDTDLPVMLPPPELFAGRMRDLGLSDSDRIVLYDDSPWRTAARGWLTFRSFGMTDVAILDGGLAKWRAEGRPLTTEVESAPNRHFTPRDAGVGIRDMAAMRANLDTAVEQMVDARSATRFSGAEADPRPGVLPGHIPDSRNLPYTQVFNPDGTYKPLDDVAKAFADAGIDLTRPVAATCGSGVTASTLAFAAHLLGHEIAVYDGSWSEWGADPTTPKATA